jgi:hypothetical protein
MTIQEAFDKAGEMLEECYRRLEGIDEAARNIMMASLHWR